MLVMLSAYGSAAAYEVGGSAALTSDYVWRGSTQSRGDAAMQAGFRVAADSGWYTAVWGSSVEFAPETRASSELDISTGWSGPLADDWTLDANVLRYRYPATTVDLDWTELNATLTWKENYWAAVGWSSQALGTPQDGVYAQLGGCFPLAPRLRLETAVGWYQLQGAAGGGYAHGQLGVVWAVAAPWEVRVTAHATDNQARALFGREAAGNRWEAAVQASF